MITLEDVKQLVEAWARYKEPGAGLALHDAMEELGWPWIWVTPDEKYPQAAHALYFPGYAKNKFVALAFERLFLTGKSAWDVWNIFPGIGHTMRTDVPAESLKAAKHAAEEYIKRWLKDEVQGEPNERRAIS